MSRLRRNRRESENHAWQFRVSTRMFSHERKARIDHYDTLDLTGLLAMEGHSPRDVDLLVSIGQHYLKQRQLDQCRAYYSKALGINPDDGWTHLYMGNLCYALACYDEAATYFLKAIELLPKVACPHWCLADVYDKQGYWERTEVHYRRAVEIEPSDTNSKRKLDDWLADNRRARQISRQAD